MPLRMFVRFRQTANRLQASLVETRRVDGKVRHEHVASLGSVPTPPSVADRIDFWRRLHDRLAKLANRVDAETHGKILGAVHDRVLMPTPEEQRALQLENAKADAKFWESVADMHAGTVTDHKALFGVADAKIAASEAERAKAAERHAYAKERLGRIERGEIVEGGIGKPMSLDDFEAILLKAGWTKQDIREAVQHAELSKIGAWEELMKEIHKRRDQSEKAALRAVWRHRIPVSFFAFTYWETG